LENIDLTSTSGNDSGGLAGYLFGITVSNSYVTGTISVVDAAVGGFAGFADYDNDAGGISATVIENSYADVDITCSDYCYAGGLVGWGYGTHRNSYAIGDISAPSSDFVGGFAGESGGGFYNVFA